MEDINNALSHIKSKYNGEIPYQYGSRECAKLMDSYAKEYHERQLKLLGIANVVGQIEQFCECDGVQDLIAGTGECRKCGKECTY